MIPVTKPFLPPHKEFMRFTQEIWKSNILTNDGLLVRKLEQRLREHLGVDHLLYVANGTIALQIAIKALALEGEIITTPFSYVATASSIVWEGCKPIFVDIKKDSFNIDAEKIEGAVTRKTTAILATHVFGNPCDIYAIEAIARRHNLKVIYDAAHSFGTTYEGRSVYEYGDISATSFHATKLFHTTEGGAVFTQNPKLFKRMAYMRNFGHDGPESFVGVGINGKNSEFHAAMGLCNLKYIKDIMQSRKTQSEYYNKLLKDSTLGTQKVDDKEGYNFSYYPVVFESEKKVLNVLGALAKVSIFPRRYFFPCLSKLSYVEKSYTPISDYIASRILCLPLYHSLTTADQELITETLLRASSEIPE